MQDDDSKKVKRILAVVYLLVMAFVVGGSYLHQQQSDGRVESDSALPQR